MKDNEKTSSRKYGEETKSGSKFKTVVRSICCQIFCIILGFGIWAIYHFTNGFNEEFKTFYIVIDGDEVLQSEKKLNFLTDKEYKIGIVYTFDQYNPSAQPRGYSVKITTYVTEENDFEFTLDGNPALYSILNGTDVTEYFVLEQSDSYFKFSIPSELKLQSVIEGIYPNDAVTVPSSADIGRVEYFKMTVSSYNGQNTVTLYFTAEIAANGIVIDPSETIN